MRDFGADFDSTAMWFSRLGVGALLIPEFSMWAGLSIKSRHAMSVFDDDRRLSAISKIDLVAPDFGLGFRSPDDR